MKLTILGATGSVGRELVNQALDAGHMVTVLVRNPEKLGASAARVTAVQGNVTDSDAVNRAISNADAVLNTLGHTRDSSDDILTIATSNTIKAMRQYGVRRLVVLSNIFLSDPNDHPSFGQKVQGALAGLAMAQINKDHAAQAQVVTDSELDWTIVRSAVLANGPHSGKYKVGKQLDNSAGGNIARANVADFMLSILDSTTYIRSKPVVSQ